VEKAKGETAWLKMQSAALMANVPPILPKTEEIFIWEDPKKNASPCIL
jgi:hypothetical protein